MFFKKNFTPLIFTILTSITFADYSAKIPLELNEGGSLPNGSINFSVVPPPPYSSSAPNCNYSGNRTDGVPRYNGYTYHHIEYHGPGILTTVWFENNYIGSIYPEDLINYGYSLGDLIYKNADNETPGYLFEYYEICKL